MNRRIELTRLTSGRGSTRLAGLTRSLASLSLLMLAHKLAGLPRSLAFLSLLRATGCQPGRGGLPRSLAFLSLLMPALMLAAAASADFSRWQPGQDSSMHATGPYATRFEARQAFVKARQMIKSGQFERYYRLKPTLQDYALYPYLEYTEFAWLISRQSEEDILGFAETYKDTSFADDLLRHWLENLAKRRKWDSFLEHYDMVTPTKTLACHHGLVLHKAKRKAEMLQAVAKLWLVGFSQPDECDATFKAWRDAGGLTPELAWQRFALALKSGNRQLAGYLMRYLPQADRAYANNFRLVQRSPATIKRIRSFAADNPKNREIILEGVRLLARSDPEEALGILQMWGTRHSFEPTALRAAYVHLGILLAQQSDSPELVEALPLAPDDHPELLEARLRQALRLGNWADVPDLISQLPTALQESNRWRYWKAKVQAGLGDTRADRAARRDALKTLETLMLERSFYGFLSADLLSEAYHFKQAAMIDVSMEQMLEMEKMPGIARALELLALDERPRARMEWKLATRQFSDAQRQIAANLALRWGWYKASIQVMIDGQAWDYLDARFPMAYEERFRTQARRTDLPIHWSLAVARQESAFMPDAKSSSGALGLMQLMPATARLVAKGLGLKYDGNRALTEPSLNIRLGTQYLGQMLRRFDNNRILATAAYNAGPSRVDKWIEHDAPLDAWIETIPYNETRNYVQNVLMFSRIYAKKLNEPGPLIYPHEYKTFREDELATAMLQQLARLDRKPRGR